MSEPISTVGAAKLWSLIGGAIGAALGVAISNPMSKKRAWLCILSGIVLGGSMAPVIGWYKNIPPDLWGYIACIIGLPGIGVANAIIIILRDPIGTYLRIRGKKNV